MPKGVKSPTNEKSVYVKFTERPEDQRTYMQLAAEAEAKRYELGTYIMLVLNAALTPADAEQGQLPLSTT